MADEVASMLLAYRLSAPSTIASWATANFIQASPWIVLYLAGVLIKKMPSCQLLLLLLFLGLCLF
jgi:hypothetical protein